MIDLLLLETITTNVVQVTPLFREYTLVARLTAERFG
jgi:hypothetical protein